MHRPSAPEQTVEGKTPPVAAFHFPTLPSRAIVISHLARCWSVIASNGPNHARLGGPDAAKGENVPFQTFETVGQENHR